jgi:uncharacterized protein YnzC (UPF0291/DUF896 family)
MKKTIDRINELARKAKSETLTAEELAERDELRKKYIQFVTGQVRGNLDNIRYVDEDGNVSSTRTSKGEQGSDN